MARPASAHSGSEPDPALATPPGLSVPRRDRAGSPLATNRREQIGVSYDGPLGLSRRTRRTATWPALIQRHALALTLGPAEHDLVPARHGGSLALHALPLRRCVRMSQRLDLELVRLVGAVIQLHRGVRWPRLVSAWQLFLRGAAAVPR